MSTPSTTPVTALPKSPPDMRVAMNLFARELAASLAGAQNATIQSFDPATQTANVSLNSAIVVGYQSDASGQKTVRTTAYPLLPAVPVVVIGGGGGAVTFPIAVGDTCLLVFLDRDMDIWWTTGQTGVAPNTNRLHNMSDAIAIVGLRSKTGALQSYSTTDSQFYGPDGPGGPIVSLGGGKVRIANASETLKTNIDTLFSNLDDLIDVLTNWVDTRGDTPNPATKAALAVVKTEFDNTKADFDALLKA